MTAAAKDLITLARAKQNIQAITDNSQDTLLQTLLTACSDGIEKYCRRRFISQAYDELYNGDGQKRLLLRQYPLQSVQSVRYRPVTVLKIINNATSTNQQARVSVTNTGLTLFRAASGVKTTDTSVTYAGNVTLNAVAAAVNALGNGWSAQIVGDAGNQGGQGDYGLWPSADLYVPSSFGDPLEGAGVQQSQGAQNARGAFAELKMHTYELQGYQWDARGWLLRAIPYTDPELQHPEDLVWPVGVNNFRIQYTSGYTTVPEAVQEACAEWTAMMYYATLRDPLVMGQKVYHGLEQQWSKIPLLTQAPDSGRPPQRLLPLLHPYRRWTVGTNQG
jgi:hypothetical protein